MRDQRDGEQCPMGRMIKAGIEGEGFWGEEQPERGKTEAVRPRKEGLLGGMLGSNLREGRTLDMCRGRKATLGPDCGGLGAWLRHVGVPEGLTLLSSSGVLAAV